MSEEPSISATERIAASYKRLASSAANLNKVSDEFGKPVEAIERALRLLNVGVEAWEKIRGNDNDGYENYWHEYVGFAKVGGMWRIALSKVEGNHTNPEREEDETWAFEDAPRSLRISAIDKLPDLMEKLIEASDKTARKMQSKANDVIALASAVSGAAKDLSPKKKGAQ
jgi:hypothetical protein